MVKKLKTSVAIDRELIDWIDEMIQKKRFANRSHAVEYSLTRLREEMAKSLKELLE